jgi:hypothetical protein
LVGNGFDWNEAEKLDAGRDFRSRGAVMEPLTISPLCVRAR